MNAELRISCRHCTTILGHQQLCAQANGFPKSEKYFEVGLYSERALPLRFCLKDEVKRERLAIGDGDFLAFRAVDLMPGRDCIFSLGKVR